MSATRSETRTSPRAQLANAARQVALARQAAADPPALDAAAWRELLATVLVLSRVGHDAAITTLIERWQRREIGRLR